MNNPPPPPKSEPPPQPISGSAVSPETGSAAAPAIPHQVSIPPALAAQLAARIAASGAFPAAPMLQMGVAQMWQGPYPPPEAMERYERILPGAFERIIKMAENLQAAQIEQSGTVIELTDQNTRRGQWLGWTLAAFSVVGAVVALWLGSQVGAVAFLGVPIAGVCRSLIEAARKPQNAAVPMPPAAVPPG